jgi:hypothetical protein
VAELDATVTFPVRAGEFDRTTETVPVDVVTPVPPRDTASGKVIGIVVRAARMICAKLILTEVPACTPSKSSEPSRPMTAGRFGICIKLKI